MESYKTRTQHDRYYKGMKDLHVIFTCHQAPRLIEELRTSP